MAQTRIVIVAPDTASPGELIDVQVSIYNITTNPEPHNIDWCCPVVRVGGKTKYVGDERNIAYWEPIDVETWSFKYLMPAESITMVVESWFESGYYSWHLDTTKQKTILLKEITAEFSGFSIATITKIQLRRVVMETETTIVAPGIAYAGDVVTVEVTVENTTTTPEPHNIDGVIPVVKINGIILEGSEEPLAYFGDEKTHTWSFQFIMPNNSVVIAVETWFESYYYDWHLESVTTKTVLVEGVQPPINITQMLPVFMMILMVGLLMPMIAE